MLAILAGVICGAEGWIDIFEEEVVMRAIIDRVVHHAHIFNIKGKSYRTKRLKKEDTMG